MPNVHARKRVAAKIFVQHLSQDGLIATVQKSDVYPRVLYYGVPFSRMYLEMSSACPKCLALNRDANDLLMLPPGQTVQRIECIRHILRKPYAPLAETEGRKKLAGPDGLEQHLPEEFYVAPQ